MYFSGWVGREKNVFVIMGKSGFSDENEAKKKVLFSRSAKNSFG